MKKPELERVYGNLLSKDYHLLYDLLRDHLLIISFYNKYTAKGTINESCERSLGYQDISKIKGITADKFAEKCKNIDLVFINPCK